MNAADNNFIKLHEQWAQWAYITFAFRYPNVKAVLYGLRHSFFILVDTNVDQFQTISTIFHNEIRPITADIKIVLRVPDGAVKIQPTITLEDEQWNAGQALSIYQLQRFLGMTVPNFPSGSIDFNSADDQWEFSTTEELSTEQKDRVLAGARTLKIQGDIHFLTVAKAETAIARDASQKAFKGHALEIISAREMNHFPSSIRKMVEKDEDEWRTSINRRAGRYSDEPIEHISESASCLFCPDLGAELKLAELLTIYDEIKLIPPRKNLDWLKHHQLTQSDLKELIESGRISLVFPGSIDNYPALFEIIEDHPESVVLSRSLAGKIIRNGEKKDPLLYGPFTNFERASVLAALSDLPDKFSQTLVSSYARHFEGQNPALLSWGAMASLGYGSGAHLGELIYELTGRDARVELSTAGAGVEWALGLNSAYIPRSYGEGYDETHNSLLVASYLSKTTILPADPVSNRLHTIANGLLSLSGIPPVELARNFDSRSAKQFRRTARQLMAGTADIDVLKEIIIGLNEDILKFEKRSSFLSKLKIDTVVTAALANPVNNAVDSVIPFGSIAAMWIYEQLKVRLPHFEILDELKQIILGLAMASSNDVVVISRARADLQKTTNSIKGI